MDQNSINTVNNNNLLKNVDTSNLNIGTRIGKLKSVNCGEVLYRAGDVSKSVYMVLNGEINLLKKNKIGKSQSIVYSNNDFFGAKELFANEDRCSTTVSLTDSYLIELSKEEMNYLIKQDEKIAFNVKKEADELKFDKNVIEVIGSKIADSYDDTFDEEEEIIDDFINQNDMQDILNEWKKEDEEEEELNDFKSFGEESIKDINNINSKEIIDNKVKNSYNSESNDKNLKEKKMDASENKEFISVEQFEMVLKALQLVNANVKRDDVLKNIVDVAINLTNADRGTLYLVDRTSNEIWSKVLVGNELEEIRLNLGEGLSGWVAENGEILNIKNVDEDERFDGSFDKATGYKTKNMLVFPIKDKTEQTVGVLQLLNSLKGEFSHQDEKFLNAISLNTALALDNASLVEQLVSSERDTSIGKMGSFLAYDIKKPILTCKRYAEHLKKKDLPFDAKQVVNLLVEQLDQVSNQVSAASSFTEGTTLLRRQEVNLNSLLHEFAINVHPLLQSHNCKIEYEMDIDTVINIDKKEFYQCFYNIVKNSCEALNDGGNIIITTEKFKDSIEISFNDKGTGIEPENISKVFNPLFTKNKPNHSGLGLSISKKIIEDHSGEISIKSDKESGTTVKLSLPIH